MPRTVLVIGADRGIGPEVARILSRERDDTLFLAGARAPALAARPALHFLPVDIASVASVVELRHRLQDAGARPDLVVNVASCTEAYGGSATEQIRSALDDNFYGWLNVGKLVYPLLRDGGRALTVTSARGLLAALPGERARARLGDAELGEDALVRAVQEYEAAGRRGCERAEGWGAHPVAAAKVALTALCDLQHRQLRARGAGAACVHPGDPVGGAWDAAAAETVARAALDLQPSWEFQFVWSDGKNVDWRHYIETRL